MKSALFEKLLEMAPITWNEDLLRQMDEQEAIDRMLYTYEDMLGMFE